MPLPLSELVLHEQGLTANSRGWADARQMDQRTFIGAGPPVDRVTSEPIVTAQPSGSAWRAPST